MHSVILRQTDGSMTTVQLEFERFELEAGKNSWMMLCKKLPVAMRLDLQQTRSLWELCPKERARGVMFGKEMQFPRWNQMFGKHGYRFAGKEHPPVPITHPSLQKLLTTAQQLSEKSDAYQDMLVNFYGDGNDCIGAHSDKEAEMIPELPIYSFSFGQKRDFVVTAINGTFKLRLALPDNSLLIMGGHMQAHYKHSVPRLSKRTIGGRRINVTVRPMRDIPYNQQITATRSKTQKRPRESSTASISTVDNEDIPEMKRVIKKVKRAE